MLNVRNPATGETIAEVSVATTEDVDRAVAETYDQLPLVPEMPHGGVKQSGYGEGVSMYGLEDYTVVQHVMASLS